jgi:transposase-like protein
VKAPDDHRAARADTAAVAGFAWIDPGASEEQCEAALYAARWPEGFVCPSCGAGSAWPFRRGRQPYWQCTACGYQCSLVVGTLFEGTKLSLSRWFLAMNLMSQARRNVSALELKRQLGVSYPSARLMKRKLMRVAVRRNGRLEFSEARLIVRRVETEPKAASMSHLPSSHLHRTATPTKL